MSKRRHSAQVELLPVVESGASVPVAKPELQGVIDAFHTAYLTSYGKPPTWGAKRAAMLKRLVAQLGAPEVKERIAHLFGGSGPQWLQPPYDVETFVRHIDKLVTAAPRRPSDYLGGK